MDDQTLLNRFTAKRSEEAFRTLVSRHLGMVLGIAQRRTGNRALAEDVAQNVFTALAQKARRLSRHTSLTGWLFRATLNECAMAHRRNQTHARKMNELSERLLNDSDGRDIWEEAMPFLDEAIDKLPKGDRELILLRFFEHKSFRDIGQELGKTESAAQKQGERALVKLSASLKRRGVVASSTLLGSCLATKAIAATSENLITTVTGTATEAAVGTVAKLTIIETLQAMNLLPIKTATVVTVVAAIPVISHWNSNQELRRELSELREQKPQVIEVVKEQPSTLAVSRQRPARTANDPAPAMAQTASAERADTWHDALHEQDPIRRMQRIGALLAQLTPAQAPAIAAQFEDLQKRGRHFSEEYRLFLRAWGRIDGHAAMAHVAPDGFTRHNSNMLAALAGWASVKPFAARGWVDALAEGKSKEELIYGLLDGWSMVDFASAAAYAETRPRSTARNRFRGLLLQRSLSAGGVPAAQQWFHRIADDEHNSKYKELAFNEVIQAMLYRDPSAAAQWISQLGEQKFVTAKPIIQTAASLAKNAPEQAMHFLQNSEHVDAQILLGGKEQVLSKWAAKDPLAAGNYLQQINNSAEYDKLAGSYARSIASVDADKALQWAKSIGNEALRGKAERRVVASLANGGMDRQELIGRGYPEEYIDSAVKGESRQLVMAGGFGGMAGAEALHSISFTADRESLGVQGTKLLSYGNDGKAWALDLRDYALDTAAREKAIAEKEKTAVYEIRTLEEEGQQQSLLFLSTGDELGEQVKLRVKTTAPGVAE